MRYQGYALFAPLSIMQQIGKYTHKCFWQEGKSDKKKVSFSKFEHS
jgi:hypothetical protein